MYEERVQNGVKQHRHDGYDYWHDATTVHHEGKPDEKQINTKYQTEGYTAHGTTSAAQREQMAAKPAPARKPRASQSYRNDAVRLGGVNVSFGNLQSVQDFKRSCIQRFHSPKTVFGKAFLLGTFAAAKTMELPKDVADKAKAKRMAQGYDDAFQFYDRQIPEDGEMTAAQSRQALERLADEALRVRQIINDKGYAGRTDPVAIKYRTQYNTLVKLHNSILRTLTEAQRPSLGSRTSVRRPDVQGTAAPPSAGGKFRFDGKTFDSIAELRQYRQSAEYRNRVRPGTEARKSLIKARLAKTI